MLRAAVMWFLVECHSDPDCPHLLLEEDSCDGSLLPVVHGGSQTTICRHLLLEEDCLRLLLEEDCLRLLLEEDCHRLLLEEDCHPLLL